ncbi:hypothetical protein C2845_PM13G05650 [Panicum miliaceum]|uniref:ATP-citrate synthase citrate-binding domain-containing protein n=1 Tax=Panicum miliaceum TaxID=4540 RepID=A0A3L6RIA4_PANMI|nr:hypothetical protein C2845_PM13G05650 [Panicum miliaceum]
MRGGSGIGVGVGVAAAPPRRRCCPALSGRSVPVAPSPPRSPPRAERPASPRSPQTTTSTRTASPASRASPQPAAPARFASLDLSVVKHAGHWCPVAGGGGSAGSSSSRRRSSPRDACSATSIDNPTPAARRGARGWRELQGLAVRGPGVQDEIQMLGGLKGVKGQSQQSSDMMKHISESRTCHHIDHKVIAKEPSKQISIVKVASNLARHAKLEALAQKNDRLEAILGTGNGCTQTESNAKFYLCVMDLLEEYHVLANSWSIRNPGYEGLMDGSSSCAKAATKRRSRSGKGKGAAKERSPPSPDPCPGALRSAPIRPAAGAQPREAAPALAPRLADCGVVFVVFGFAWMSRAFIAAKWGYDAGSIEVASAKGIHTLAPRCSSSSAISTNEWRMVVASPPAELDEYPPDRREWCFFKNSYANGLSTCRGRKLLDGGEVVHFAFPSHDRLRGGTRVSYRQAAALMEVVRFSTNRSGQVGDLGYALELGNYAEYNGAPNEEVLQYARVVLDCATADPDGCKRALLIGGGTANFTDVAATFSGIIRALREKRIQALFKGHLHEHSSLMYVMDKVRHPRAAHLVAQQSSPRKMTALGADCGRYRHDGDGDLGGLGPAQRDGVHLPPRDVRPMPPQARGPCIPAWLFRLHEWNTRMARELQEQAGRAMVEAID